MRTIALIARGALTYQGQRIAAGVTFQAVPVDAAVLRYQRKVDFAPRGRASAVSPASGLPPAVAPSLVPSGSDAPSAAVAEHIAENDHEDEPPRRRRQYRRRDLTAED